MSQSSNPPACGYITLLVTGSRDIDYTSARLVPFGTVANTSQHFRGLTSSFDGSNNTDRLSLDSESSLDSPSTRSNVNGN